MSRKKQHDVTKSMITDSQLQESIKNNVEVRKLKIQHTQTRNEQSTRIERHC